MSDAPFQGYEIVLLAGRKIEPKTQQGEYIFFNVIPKVIEMFLGKNQDYGDTSFELGIKGQYAELHRKMGKLKRSMWDGEELMYEKTDEVLTDLIGHCLLSLYFLEREKIGVAAMEADTASASVYYSDKILELSGYLKGALDQEPGSGYVEQ